jgi:hypothetical protein
VVARAVLQQQPMVAQAVMHGKPTDVVAEVLEVALQVVWQLRAASVARAM